MNPTLQVHLDHPRYAFVGRFSERFRIVVVGNVYHGQGSSPWLNPGRPQDVALLQRKAAHPFCETDSLLGLEMIQTKGFAPMNETVVYQPWPEPGPGARSRPLKAMPPEDARRVAEILKGGPTRSLMLVATGFMTGAIGALGEALEGHDLEYLGLCWHYSGDDLTDRPSYPEEIAATCRRLNLQRLTLLTGAFNDSVDRALKQALTSGTRVKVFQKDEDSAFPLLATY